MKIKETLVNFTLSTVYLSTRSNVIQIKGFRYGACFFLCPYFI